jgi:hypothetical protein
MAQSEAKAELKFVSIAAFIATFVAAGRRVITAFNNKCTMFEWAPINSRIKSVRISLSLLISATPKGSNQK